MTSEKIPDPQMFQAVEKGTNNQLLLNGIAGVNVPYALVKQTTELAITDGKID